MTDWFFLRGSDPPPPPLGVSKPRYDRTALFGPTLGPKWRCAFIALSSLQNGKRINHRPWGEGGIRDGKTREEGLDKIVWLGTVLVL